MCTLSSYIKNKLYYYAREGNMHLLYFLEYSTVTRQLYLGQPCGAFTFK